MGVEDREGSYRRSDIVPGFRRVVGLVILA